MKESKKKEEDAEDVLYQKRGGWCFSAVEQK